MLWLEVTMLTGRCKLYVLTTALSFSLMPQGASALGFSAFDGTDMLKHCKAWVSLLDNSNFQDLDNPDTLRAMARGDLVNGAHCVGYVQGVIDDHFSCQINETSSAAALDPVKHFCLPDGVTPNQTVRVIVKWLEDHPARLHEKAIGLVLDALRDNFPCRQKN
jgi:Rap1a immunity proteins